LARVLPAYSKVVDALAPLLREFPGGIVTIDGRDGVGKTTLGRYLAWHFNVTLIETDLFLIPAQDYLIYLDDQINRIIERRATIPILSHVLLTAQAGQGATLTATDLDIVAKVHVAAAGDGAAALPGDLLRQLIARAEGDDVTIDLPADGGRAAIRCGRARTHLNVLLAADFPVWDPRDYPHRVELGGAELADVLARCATAMEAGKSAAARPWLAGVYLHDEAGDLAATATDGHRLHRRIVSGADGAFGEGVIVGDKTVRVLAGLVAGVARSPSRFATRLSASPPAASWSPPGWSTHTRTSAASSRLGRRRAPRSTVPGSPQRSAAPPWSASAGSPSPLPAAP
jgi:hypothetical protein